MRLAALTLAVALGTAASAVSVNAAPIVPNLNSEAASNIVQVSGGCGWGLHRYHGYCVRDRVAYYAPRYYAPRYYAPRHYAYRHYTPYGYYGGGYRPQHYWHGY